MFITIEGIDGAGKSTQAEKLTRWLESITGRKTIHTFEPGGWPDGKTFREFILSSKNFCAMSELLLFLADRSEHADKVILPELKAGHNVICERWNDSTLAYQSGGHELEISHVQNLIQACNFPEPDIKILLDISPELALTRIKSRKNKLRETQHSKGLKINHDKASSDTSGADNYLPERFEGSGKSEALNSADNYLQEQPEGSGKNDGLNSRDGTAKFQASGQAEESDKFEAEGLQLMRDVADFYRSHSSGFIIINCDKLDIDQTFAAIIAKLEAHPCVQSR